MNEIKKELLESKEYLLAFIKNPVLEIRRIPDWSWKRLLLIQVLITMISAALSGIVAQSRLAIIWQMITMPILTLIMLFVSCFFFYYAFQIFADKTLPFRTLFATVFFANIPFFILQIISPYFSPILLIGFGFTALLLIVAFVDFHKLPKKLTLRLIGTLYLVFLLIWIWGRIDGSRIDKTWKSPKVEAPEVILGQ